ncbi:hypothetical protein LINPERHAP2_LOCUS9487 [Linum perenne]
MWRRVRRVEYEGLHVICFNCGIYGHNKDDCPSLALVNADAGQLPEGATFNNPVFQAGGLEIPRPKLEEDFGTWMLAKKNARHKQKSILETKDLDLVSSPSKVSNSFSVLENEDPQEVDIPVEENKGKEDAQPSKASPKGKVSTPTEEKKAVLPKKDKHVSNVELESAQAKGVSSSTKPGQRSKLPITKLGLGNQKQKSGSKSSSKTSSGMGSSGSVKAILKRESEPPDGKKGEGKSGMQGFVSETVFSWNCRGAGHKKYLATFRSYLGQFKPSIVFILEPRISGNKADVVSRKLGYTDCVRVDSVGFAGGIWVLWSSSVTKLRLISSGDQFIHLQGSCQDHEKFFLTAIYGPRFTWKWGAVNERLDRALINPEWLVAFPHTKVSNLFRIKSDHRAILADMGSKERDKLVWPFRFLAPWLSHSEFGSFLRDKWERGSDLPFQLANLTSDLRRWNKEVFGHILTKKKELIARLEDLEIRTDAAISDQASAQENEIRTQLEEVLWQEELLWIQKFMANWVVDGDRNTSFFFFFANLFADGGEAVSLDFVPTVSISQEDADRLSTPISSEEIAIAVREMGALKAPGVDGFQPVFFQKCRPTVGRDFVSFIKDIFIYPEHIRRRVTLATSVLNSIPAYAMQTAKLPWSINNGRSTSFWNDCWLDSGSTLREHASDNYRDDWTEKVVDFLSNANSWDVQRLAEVLSQNMVHEVVGMAPGLVIWDKMNLLGVSRLMASSQLNLLTCFYCRIGDWRMMVHGTWFGSGTR